MRALEITRRLGASACLTFALHAIAFDISGKIVDQRGAPVANAVVTATTATPATAPQRAAEIDQADKEFVPFVTVVQTGSSITFPNHDTVRHQIYSFSPAKKFDLPLYAQTTPPPVPFDKPGVVVIGCNIHDWMLAYIDVVDTPYFTKTDATGTVALSGLPRGQYTVQVWHPNLKDPLPATRVVTINTNDFALGTIVLHLQTPAPLRHAPLPNQRDY